jgi:hypothetical protein
MNSLILISEIEEIGSELGEPDCKLINPYIIGQPDMNLIPWMEEYCSPEIESFMIHSDKILTITSPKDTLLKKYIEKTSS